MLQDLYVLAGDRTPATVERFRDQWLVGFAETADEYEVPWQADQPETVHADVDELLQLLMARPAEAYGLYWHNTQPGPVRSAMLFFTTDGGLIAGLSLADEASAPATRLLAELGATVNATEGYGTFEEPPPDTVPEFRDRSRRAAVRLG